MGARGAKFLRTQNGGFRPGQIEEGGVLTAPSGALPLVIEVAGIAQVPHVAHHSHSVYHNEVLCHNEVLTTASRRSRVRSTFPAAPACPAKSG
jgi:hypothetical protein